jgi:hypothetical protein
VGFSVQISLGILLKIKPLNWLVSRRIIFRLTLMRFHHDALKLQIIIKQAAFSQRTLSLIDD